MSPTCPWGPEDQIGAANYMTPETKAAALKRIQHGKSYDLGVRIVSDSPAWADRHHTIRIRQVHDGEDSDQITFLDDFLDCSVGIGTHIDTMAHVSVHGEMYNGNRVEDVFSTHGAKKLALDFVTSFIAPVVVLDIAAYLGVQIMTGGFCITLDLIKGAMERQNVTISKGDIVCIHTGWIHYFEGSEETKQKFSNTQPGIGSEAARFFADLGVIMVAADNWGLEVYPKEKGEPNAPVHRMLLKERGVYIGELFDLRDVVRDEVWTGTIVIQLVRNVGTVQARCNPQIFI